MEDLRNKLGKLEGALEHIEEDYTDLEITRKGQFGIVLKGYSEMRDGLFAIQIISKGILFPDMAKLMDKEIKILLKCKHRNVLKVTQIFKRESFIFIVTPLSYISLSELMQKGNLTKEVGINYIMQICSGLIYLHDKEIIHGALKSENILLYKTKGGNLKPQMVDYGFSKFLKYSYESEDSIRAYLPPEYMNLLLNNPQLLQKRESTEGDIWALGVILYQILEGELPFPIVLSKEDEGNLGVLNRYEYRPLCKENAQWGALFGGVFMHQEGRIGAQQMLTIMEEISGGALNYEEENSISSVPVNSRRSLEVPAIIPLRQVDPSPPQIISLTIPNRGYPPATLLLGSAQSGRLLSYSFAREKVEEGIKCEGRVTEMCKIGEYIGVATSSGVVYLYESKTQCFQWRIPIPGNRSVYDICGLGEDILLMACGKSERLFVYKITTQELKEVAQNGCCVAVNTYGSNNEEQIICGSNDKKYSYIKIIDPNSLSTLYTQTLKSPILQIVPIIEATTPSILVSTTEGKIYLWEVEKGELGELEGGSFEGEMDPYDKNRSLCQIAQNVVVWGMSHGALHVYDLGMRASVHIISAIHRKVTSIKSIGHMHFVVANYGGLTVFSSRDYAQLLQIHTHLQIWAFHWHYQEGGYGSQGEVGSRPISVATQSVVTQPVIIQPVITQPITQPITAPSNKGELMLYGGYKQRLMVRDLKSKMYLKEIPVSGIIYKIEAMGENLVAIGLSSSKVLIFNLKSMEIEGEHKAQGEGAKLFEMQSQIYDIVELPDERLAMTGGCSKKVEIINYRSMERQKTLEHGSGTIALCVYKNMLVCGGENMVVKAWELDTWNLSSQCKLLGAICQILLLQDDSLAISTRVGAIYIWDMGGDKTELLVRSGVDAQIGTNTLNKAVSMCEVNEGVLAYGSTSYGTVILLNYKENREIGRVEVGHRRITRIKCSPCEHSRFIICTYGAVHIYSTTDYRELSRFQSEDDAWDILLFSTEHMENMNVVDVPDRTHKISSTREREYSNEYLLVGGYTERLYLKENPSGDIKRNIDLKRVVTRMLTLECGHILIGVEGGCALVWDVNTHQIGGCIESKGNNILDMALLPSPHSVGLATQNSNLVEIFEISGGSYGEYKRMGELVHPQSTTAVCRAEGKGIATGSVDGILRLWVMVDNIEYNYNCTTEVSLDGNPIVQILPISEGRLCISTYKTNKIHIFTTSTGDKHIISNISIDAEITSVNPHSTSLKKSTSICEVSPGVLMWGTQKLGVLQIWDIKEQKEKGTVTIDKENGKRITSIYKYNILGGGVAVGTYASVAILGNDWKVKERINCPSQAWDFQFYTSGEGKGAVTKVIDTGIKVGKNITGGSYPPEYIIAGTQEGVLSYYSYHCPSERKNCEYLSSEIYEMTYISENIISLGLGNGMVHIFDVVERRIVHTIPPKQPMKIFSIIRIKEGNSVQMGVNEGDSMNIYSTGEYKKLSSIKHGSVVTASLWINTTGEIVTGGVDGKCKVWKLEGETKGDTKWKYRISKSKQFSSTHPIVQIVGVCNGDLVISTGDRRLALWGYKYGVTELIPNPEIDAELGEKTSNKACSLCELRPGVLIWGTSTHGVCKVYSTHAMKVLHVLKLGDNSRITHIRLIALDQFVLATYTHIKIFHMATFSQILSFSSHGSPYAFSWFGHGATPSTDIPVLPLNYDPVENDIIEEKKEVIAPAEIIVGTKSFKAPKHIMLGSFSKEISLLDFWSGEIIERVSLEGFTNCMEELSNGNIAIGLDIGEICIWSPRDSNLISKIRARGSCYCMKELNAGKSEVIIGVASGESKLVEIIDVNNRKCIGELAHPEGTISISTLPKDELATGCHDAIVRIWKKRDNHKYINYQLRSFDDMPIVQILLLEDGRLAITTKEQRNVYLWNYISDTFQILRSLDIDANYGLFTKNKALNLCEIHPGILAFGSLKEFGKIRFWNIKKEKYLSYGERGRRITIIKKVGDLLFVGTYSNLFVVNIKDMKLLQSFNCENQAWDFVCCY